MMTYAQAADYLMEQYPDRFIDLDAEIIKDWWKRRLISHITAYHLDIAAKSGKLPTFKTDIKKPESSTMREARDLVWEYGLYNHVFGRSDRIGI